MPSRQLLRREIRKCKRHIQNSPFRRRSQPSLNRKDSPLISHSKTIFKSFKEWNISSLMHIQNTSSNIRIYKQFIDSNYSFNNSRYVELRNKYGNFIPSMILGYITFIN